MTAALLASANVMSDSSSTSPSGSTTIAAAEAGAGNNGTARSNAKDNCKKLGGKWKPIRKICKIDSIVNKDL